MQRSVYTLVSYRPESPACVAGGHNATAGYQLTGRDVIGDVIMYVHDGSDTSDDAFRLSLQLRTAANEVVALDHVIDVNITIQPINDEPFTLKTHSPQLDVLQVIALEDAAILALFVKNTKWPK